MGTTDEVVPPPLAKPLPVCRRASGISSDRAGISLLQENVWCSSDQGLSWKIRCLDTLSAQVPFFNQEGAVSRMPLFCWTSPSSSLTLLYPFPFPNSRSSLLPAEHPSSSSPFPCLGRQRVPVPRGTQHTSSSCCCLGISVYICFSQRRPGDFPAHP